MPAPATAPYSKTAYRQKLTILASYALVREGKGLEADDRASRNTQMVAEIFTRGEFEKFTEFIDKEKITLTKNFPFVLLAWLDQMTSRHLQAGKSENEVGGRERKLIGWWMKRRDFNPYVVGVPVDLAEMQGSLTKSYRNVFEHPAFQTTEMARLLVAKHLLHLNVYNQLIHSSVPVAFMEKIWQQAIAHPKRKKELQDLVTMGKIFLHNIKHIHGQDVQHPETLAKREWCAGLEVRVEAERLRQKAQKTVTLKTVFKL